MAFSSSSWSPYFSFIFFNFPYKQKWKRNKRVEGFFKEENNLLSSLQGLVALPLTAKMMSNTMETEQLFEKNMKKAIIEN